MNVLIIAPTIQDYENTLQQYDQRLRKRHKFHHIKTKEQMQEFRMPLQIRFVGHWTDLPDAPTLEWYAAILTSQELSLDGRRLSS